MAQVVRKLLSAVAALLGKPTRCEWVAQRLLPYSLCEPSLTDSEYATIDAHLGRCRTCAARYTELNAAQDAVAAFLYPDASLPPMDSVILARAIVSASASSRPPAQPPFTVMPVRRLRRRWALCAAVVSVLVAVVPVLAAVAPNAWQVLTTSSGAAQSISATAKAEEVITAGPPSVAPSAGTPEGADRCEPTVPVPGWVVALQLDRMMSETTALAEVEAGLPHTDAEYEAWARKEYPHVMALYDVLIGKPGKSWPNLPEDIQAYLAQLANLAKTKDAPLWDGNPVNIPDWAACLYARTPEAERPTGWRALLIYSGEIFKLDWPKSAQEAIVHPTLDSFCNATLVAGCANSTVAGFSPVHFGEMPRSYVDTLVSNKVLMGDVLGYVATSCRLVRTPAFDGVENAAVELMRAFAGNAKGAECRGRAIDNGLEGLLELRTGRIHLILPEIRLSGN